MRPLYSFSLFTFDAADHQARTQKINLDLTHHVKKRVVSCKALERYAQAPA
jgi:hypothetical protein